MTLSISLDKIGKKYYKEWIFKDFSFVFESGHSYAITGANGSGKSTLLNIIAGFRPPSLGKITCTLDRQTVEMEHLHRYISIAAPYMDLIEDFTLREMIDFHYRFKPLLQGITTDELIQTLRLKHAKNKFVKDFSSGMKQRLKLGLAFYTNTPVLILDEPTSNLDTTNIDWYRSEIIKCLPSKLVIIGSNQAEEYSFCQHKIHLS